MNMGQRGWGIVLLVWALALGASALTPAASQDDQSQGRAERTIRLAVRIPQAQRVAHERYRFARWFAGLSGELPVGVTEDSYSTVLFPLGRADRAYVLLLPDRWRGRLVYGVYRYQRAGGARRRAGESYKLVYRVRLAGEDRLLTPSRPPRRREPARRLLDFLTGERTERLDGVEHVLRFALRGPVSRFARADLGARREYVGYSYYFGDDSLQVVRLSERRNALPGPAGESYYLDRDPLTGRPFPDDNLGFWRKYGLPVAAAELGLFGGTRDDARAEGGGGGR